MESKGIPTPTRVYQDFEPSMEWVPEDDSDTLLVYLPGFAKEQLRVQLRARNLIISGERMLQQNTWSRFRVEFPVSVNCDLNKISAKFEGNILFVRQPKLITPVPKLEAEEKPSAPVAPVPTPQKPVDESNVGQKTAEEKTTPTTPSNMENKEKGKEENLPKPKVEEKSEKTEGETSESKNTTGFSENTSDKKTSDSDKKMNKKVVYEELDKNTKKALENYKRAVGVFATKLKTSSNVVNTIVVLLIGLVIGIYFSGSIKSWRKV